MSDDSAGHGFTQLSHLFTQVLRLRVIDIAVSTHPTHMYNSAATIALSDIASAVRRYALVRMLGWQDVRQRYRRSALGPFWLTVSMAVMIATIGLVFGQILQSPMTEFLPFLAAGMILWSFISSVMTEGCTAFIAAEGIIKQLPIPLFVHILRTIWRNVLILAHNILIFPLVLVAVGKPLSWVVVCSIPGFLLTTLNLTWIALILALICARYRDFPQIVASILQVFYFLTPIIWMPNLLPVPARAYLLDGNPFFHLLQICRAPMLGHLPSTANWLVSLSMAIGGWTFAIIAYGRYKARVAYWL